MHSLILGNPKDHSLRFLSSASVGNKLSKMQEKDCEWQKEQSYTETPYNNTQKSPSRRERGRGGEKMR
jgi:hypothetical protein